jgi:hypothetical protein
MTTVFASHTGKIHGNPGPAEEAKGARVAAAYYNQKRPNLNTQGVIKSANLLYQHFLAERGEHFASGFRDMAYIVAQSRVSTK